VEQLHTVFQYSFGDFVLDVQEASLTCRGERIPLAPKEFNLLCVLASHAGHLVYKETIVQTVWPDTFVSDSSLFRNISVLRKLLGEDAIRTIPKRGYMFTLRVTKAEYPAEAVAQMDEAIRSGINSAIVANKPISRPAAVSSSLHSKTMRWRIAIAGSILAIASAFALYRFVALRRLTDNRNAAAGAARLFLLNENGNTLSLLNTFRRTVESTISMGADPRGAAILPDGSAIYVSLYHAGRVVALDTKNRHVIASIPVGNSPVGVAANPRPPFVYVANNYSNSVSVIDTTTNSVVRELNVGKVPTEIGISADGTRGIVTNQSGGSVTLIDTVQNEVLKTIQVGSTPVGIAFTPDSKFAWITLAGENRIAVLDVAAGEVIHRIQVGPGPVRIAMSRDGRSALASNFFSDTLTVIDTKTLEKIVDIPVGLNPVGIAFSPTGELAYVANYGSNTVSVVDLRTRSVVGTLRAGSSPVELEVLPCYASPCG